LVGWIALTRKNRVDIIASFAGKKREVETVHPTGDPG
jgi:hypothetical protein